MKAGRIGLALVTVLVGLLVASCGGDDGGGGARSEEKITIG